MSFTAPNCSTETSSLRTSSSRRRDCAVLLDFGTAREFAAGKTRRMTTTLTPGYAPLEQYGQRARFGVPSDIYALGATLYHLLTGEIPIQATDRVSGVELPAPHRLNPKVSSHVSSAVLSAMEVRVDRRPQSVGDFLKALRGFRPPSPIPLNDDPAAPAGVKAGAELLRKWDASSSMSIASVIFR